MRFTCLGSGSRGNAVVVEHRQTTILIDCGFGPRDIVRRLADRHLSPTEIDAVVITHEHNDHIAGLGRFLQMSGAPVYMTGGTARAMNITECNLMTPESPFAVGELFIFPVVAPHDAEEPVQLTIEDGARKIGLLTDIGCATPQIMSSFDNCGALMLECNYDDEMLRDNPRYPPNVKRRIAGDRGHLSNTDAKMLLAQLNTRGLRHIVAAHLSENNNRPEFARIALADALNCRPNEIALAPQKTGCNWREI